MATTFSIAAASRIRAAPSHVCVAKTAARPTMTTAASVKPQRRLQQARIMTQRSSSASGLSAPLSAAAAAASSSPTPRRRGVGDRGKPLTTTASYSTYGGRGGGGGGIIPVPDRVVALLPYLVPLLDGLRYSRFFFAQFPQAIVLLQPLQPLASAYFRIPFAGMISFFAIYMGLAENRSMSRFVRFNAMQAIILDVCMVLPGMIEYVLSPSSLSGVFFQLYKLCYNAVWIFVLASFCLAAVGCATGQMYKLPYIGDAADMRI